MKTNDLLNKAHAQLDQLNPRERKLVLYGGALAALLITWFVLLEPAIVTVQQAPATQAALVDKAGQVMRAAQELETLRGTRSRVVVPQTDVQQRLQVLLNEQGIADNTSLVQTEEGDIRLELNNVSATGFLAWLVQAESISSLRINTAEIEKTGAGVLRGHVTLLTDTQSHASAP